MEFAVAALAPRLEMVAAAEEIGMGPEGGGLALVDARDADRFLSGAARDTLR